MRICQISANDASFIFQELLENRVIDKNGKVSKRKKRICKNTVPFLFDTFNFSALFFYIE